MTGLGILELDALGIVGSPADHGQAVVVPHFQPAHIQRTGTLHRHAAAAGDDGHAQVVFDVVIDGVRSDLRGEIGHGLTQEQIDIQNQGFPLQIADAAHVVDGAAEGEPCFFCRLLIHNVLGEMNDAGHRLKMIAGSGLTKGLDAADPKLVLLGRLIDHAHPPPLPGLDIAVLDEARQRAAQRGAGAGIRRRQFAFGEKDRLGGIEPLLYFLSQLWAGMDQFLWLIGEAVFHMGIPVGICWSVVRKMGGTPILGIILGLTLVSGQLLNAYAVATTPVDRIPHWDFGYFTVDMIGYQAQVLPAILAALTLVYLERFFKRLVPTVVQMIVVPFCSLVPAVCAAHFVLGPIGWAIGSLISGVVFSGITGPLREVFAAIFGFVYAPLVITGLHHMTNAIDLQLIADYHGTMLWPTIALSNIAQGSAVLAMIYLHGVPRRRGNPAQRGGRRRFLRGHGRRGAGDPPRQRDPVRPGLRQNHDADGRFPPCGGHDARERRGGFAPCGH